MTQQPIGSIPGWDVADRMRKALRTCGVSVQDMAEYLGVSRNSIGNWINGRIDPSTQTLRLWALRTGVPFEWLQTGESPRPGDDPDGGDGVRHQGLEPRTQWFNKSPSRSPFVTRIAA